MSDLTDRALDTATAQGAGYADSRVVRRLEESISIKTGRVEGVASGIPDTLWQMVDKLNLALAAGISLPLLQWLGYQPGSTQLAQGTLSLIYALVPCGIKVAAGACLWFAPLDEGQSSHLSLRPHREGLT